MKKLLLFFVAILMSTLGCWAQTQVGFEIGETNYVLATDGAATLAESIEQAHTGVKSAKMMLSDGSPSIDFAKITIDYSGFLKSTIASCWNYVPTQTRSDLAPYLYFIVDANGNGIYDYPQDALIIQWMPTNSTTNAWFLNTLDQTSKIHVVGNRTGLGTTEFSASNSGSMGTLADLCAKTFSGTTKWGDLPIIKVRAGAGEWPGASNYFAYVDDITIGSAPPAPIITIGAPSLTTCGTLDVPITVSDFNNVGAISLVLNYDPAVFAYQTPTGVTLNSAISEADANMSSPGKFTLGWFNKTAITLADNAVLFTLHFNLLPAVSGTTTNLTWSTTPGDCEFAAPGGAPVYASTFNSLTWAIPVRPVKNTNTGLEYCKIQAALDDPLTVGGHTITVAAGTYPELVTISKSIHLEGASGAIIQAPSTLPVASDPLSNIVLVSGSGISAEISGFTIQGPGPTNCGSMGRGIFVRDGAFANIHDNQILDIRDNPFSGCQNGIAIQVGRNYWSTTGTATISNNIITGYQKGAIVVDNTGSSATISGNTITGAGTTDVTAQNGVQISRGATATIESNTISGNSYHNEANSSNWGACGILLYQSGAVALTGGNNLSGNDNNYYATGVTGTLSLGAETFGPLSAAPVTKAYQIALDANFNIDASSCTFDGISPSSASLTQLFSIEDRIWHSVDDPSKTGFVKVKPGNVYVTRTETGAHIQYGIDATVAGDMVNVQAGDYGIETAAHRMVFGTGDYQFGLFIDKANLKVIGYKAGDVPVATATEAAVVFQTGSTANFGPSGIFVQANGVTLEGLKIGDNTGSSNKTVEVVGDAFIFNKCFINTSSDNGAFYMGCWDAAHPIVTYTITNNIFNNALVSINNGAGASGAVGGRLITGNTFTGVATPYLIGFRGWNGASPAQGWIVDPVGGAIVTGNSFSNTGVDKYIVARGNIGGYDNSQMNWADMWNLNTYGNHVVTLVTESSFDVRSYDDGTYPVTRRISPMIQENVGIGQTGDVVLASSGTYREQVVIDSKSLTLKGAGSANTIISPSSASQLSSLYTYPAGTFWPGTVMASTILVKNSSAVTIKDLKVDGASVTSLPTGAGRLAGILYGESSGTIDGVAVNSIKTTGYVDRSYGIDLSATSGAQSVEVKNSNISDWGRTGIQAMGGSLTANIHDNTLVGPGTIGPNNVPNGIVFIHGVGGTAKLNIISACHYTTTDWGSVGIMVYDPVKSGIVIEQNQVSDCDAGVALAMNANNVIVKLNNLHNNGNGVQLEDGALNNTVLNNTIVSNLEGIYLNDAVGLGNKAEDNNISGNTTAGLENASASLFDASPNWWGDATGPYNNPNNTCGLGNKVIGNVNFEPWYSDAAMTTLFYVKPTFSSVPGPVTVNQHEARDPYATGTPVVTSCSTYTLTYNDDRSGLNSCNATGSILRTWTVTDASGDVATCSQTITVQDVDSPVVVVPANITQNNDAGLCSAVVTYPAPTATDFGYFQGFEDANWVSGLAANNPSTDWNEYNSPITRVVSGTDGITSKSGSAHAVINSTDNIASNTTGATSRLGGYNGTFGLGFISSVDVYFDMNDPGITAGTYGWDLDQAVSNNTGGFLRDFVYHVAGNNTGIYVSVGNGSSNAIPGMSVVAIQAETHATITTSGWYTMKWETRNNAGYLAVDFTILDASGTPVWTNTIGGTADPIATVGGNRYMWFNFISAKKLAIDNTSLTRKLVVTTDKASGIAFEKGETTVTATTVDACGHSVSNTFKVTVVDAEAPEITTCAPAQSAIVTDGCSVAMPDFTATTVASDNCGFTLSQDPVAGTMMAYQATPYTVTITAKDDAKLTASCQTTFTVQKASISGTLKYNNAGETPMNKVKLGLYNSSDVQVGGDVITADGTGAYSFTDLCAGTYTIKVKENLKDVGGINSTDAAAVNAWGTSGGTIQYVNFMAGDVTNDLYINNTDALRIQKYFVYGLPDWKFDRGSWSYWKKGVTIEKNADPKPTDFPVTVSGADVSNFDLYGMCTGDFNGSLIPTTLKSATWSMELNNNSTMNAVANQEFELPLRAASAMQVGAISMILQIPSGLVNVQNVLVNGSTITPDWVVNGDELRIGWYSSTPVNVAENGNLLTLKLKSTNAFTMGQTMEFALKFDPLNELADGNSQVISDAKLLVALVGNGVTGILNTADNNGLSLSNYPNPFKNSTTISYALPVQGKVTIQVYNSLGQLVKSLVDANQNAGDYSILMDGNSLMPGIYIAKLRLTNTGVDMTGTVKLSVLK